MMNEVTEARLRRLLLILLITIAGLYLISYAWHKLQFLSSIILLFFAAWIISFILSPVADWLQSHRLSRAWAVSLVYLALTVLLTGVITLAVPVISTQISQLAEHITLLTTPDNLQNLNNQVVTQLKSFGISDHDAHHVIDQLTNNLQNGAQQAVTSILINAADLLSSVANILLDTVIVLILSFYMMLDGRRLFDNLIERLPISWQTDVRMFEVHVSRVFGGFIRSQLIIGFSYGLLTWIALEILQVPNGFLISLIAGLIMIIPFAGPFLALVPPMALTLLEVAPADALRTELILLVILFVEQQIVMQGLAPRIMSQGVGLHPLWLFAALLLGAKEAGVWGAFFAAPVAALLAVVAREIYDRWAITSPLFSGSAKALAAKEIEQEDRLARAEGIEADPSG